MNSYDDVLLTYDSGVVYHDFAAPQPTRKRMSKAKLGLDRLTPDEKVAYATNVKTAMTGNANFATPVPTLAAVGTLITALQTKINSYNGSVTASQVALAERET